MDTATGSISYTEITAIPLSGNVSEKSEFLSPVNDGALRKFFPENFHNHKKRRSPRKKVTQVELVRFLNGQPTFSMNDAFQQFLASCRDTFKNTEYSRYELDRAIEQEWQAMDNELRRPFICSAWFRYEQNLIAYNQLIQKKPELRNNDKDAVKVDADKGQNAFINSRFATAHLTEEIKILQLDADVIVVDKPAGLSFREVRCRLLKKYPDVRPVHRLDKPTSGVMIFATNHKSASDLSRQFRNREVHKIYIADVRGVPNPKTGYVHLPLGRKNGTWKQCVDFKTGKPSLTLCQFQSQNHKGNSRLKLEPITGRTHQLRVHMARMGHPILGCTLYNPDGANDSERLHLHASKLTLTHPGSNEIVTYLSEPTFTLECE